MFSNKSIENRHKKEIQVHIRHQSSSISEKRKHGANRYDILLKFDDSNLQFHQMKKHKRQYSPVFSSENVRRSNVLPRGMHSPPVVIANSSRFLWDSDEPLSPPESSSRSISFHDLANRRCNDLSIPAFKDSKLSFNNHAPYVPKNMTRNGQKGYEYHVGPRSIGWIHSNSSSEIKSSKLMMMVRTLFSRLYLRSIIIGIVVISSLCIAISTHHRTKNETSIDKSRYDAIQKRIIESGISINTSMQVSGGKVTPQLKALDWISSHDALQLALDSDEILSRYACAVLFYSTNMNETSGWLSNFHTCSWSGISCNTSNGSLQITDISRNDHNDGGFLSREIFVALRESLVSFRWANTSLSGTLPPEIGLPKLKVLSLNNNGLSGSLPTQIFASSSLELLSLYNNNFTGTLMDNFDNMANLTALYLDSNAFYGTIPTSISMLSKLVDLRLQNNNFIGTIPPQLGRLENVQVLFLGNNNLTGPIPKSFDQMKHLQYFHVQSNSLTSIDIENSLENIVEFIGNSNSFGGTLPELFLRSDYLKKIWLANNDFVGEVPMTICNKVDTQSLDFTVDCESVTCSCCQMCTNT